METLFNKVLAWLNAKGFPIIKSVDEQAIACKIMGFSFAYYFEPDDQEFFVISFPDFYDASKLTEEDIYRIEHQINDTKKVVKCLCDEDHDVSLSVEVLTGPDPDLDTIIPRATKMLLSGAISFRHIVDTDPLQQLLDITRPSGTAS